jgi:hypothetical protein
VKPSIPAVLSILTGEIAQLPSVFPVDAVRHARQDGREQPVQAGQIAAVDDGRAKLAKQTQEIRTRLVDAALVHAQRVDLHVGALDAESKVRVVRHADDDMPISVVRDAVDEVHEAVLEASHDQVVEDVRDEGRLPASARPAAGIWAQRLNPSRAARKPILEDPQDTPIRRIAKGSIGPSLAPP